MSIAYANFEVFRLRILNRMFASWLLRRACVIWVVIRSTFATLLLLIRGDSDGRSLLGSSQMSIPIVILAVALTLFEVRRRNEALLFANFGIHPGIIVCTAAILPVALEVMIEFIR
jgi:hypothetical protein